MTVSKYTRVHDNIKKRYDVFDTQRQYIFIGILKACTFIRTLKMSGTLLFK